MLFSVIGSMLVMLGLYILLWGKSKERQNRVTNLVEEVGEAKEQDPQLQHIAISCDSRSHWNQDAFIYFYVMPYHSFILIKVCDCIYGINTLKYL